MMHVTSRMIPPAGNTGWRVLRSAALFRKGIDDTCRWEQMMPLCRVFRGLGRFPRAGGRAGRAGLCAVVPTVMTAPRPPLRRSRNHRSGLPKEQSCIAGLPRRSFTCHSAWPRFSMPDAAAGAAASAVGGAAGGRTGDRVIGPRSDHRSADVRQRGTRHRRDRARQRGERRVGEYYNGAARLRRQPGG
jgi:hypothetical protein